MEYITSMLSDQKITFVIQGKFSTKTLKTINLLNKYYPLSEIILSTWSSCADDLAAHTLNVKEIVLNEDPGGGCLTTPTIP